MQHDVENETAGGKGETKPIERVSVCTVSKGSRIEDLTSAVRTVAEAASDFSWLSRGDVVFIKVAANSGRNFPATTSPVAVQAMVSLLLEKGAGRVIVGDKAGCDHVLRLPDKKIGSTRRLFERNGLQSAAEDSGAEIHYFEEAGYDAYFADKTHRQTHWKHELLFPNILNEVDHIVLLPRVGRHLLLGSTHGLKSAVGWLRDDTRLELHRDAGTIFEKTAEINDAGVLREKSRLVLSVANKVLTTFGPDMGYCAEPDPGLVFASESFLAHDMVALGWMFWNRDFSTPSLYKYWICDPYKACPGLINQAFVVRTWGLHALFGSEPYSSVAIDSARSDPMLSRVAAMWNGWPNIQLESTDGKLPEHIERYLLDKAES
jgi:uncharacterized protein (DUF362 family)